MHYNVAYYNKCMVGKVKKKKKNVCVSVNPTLPT